MQGSGSIAPRFLAIHRVHALTTLPSRTQEAEWKTRWQKQKSTGNRFRVFQLVAWTLYRQEGTTILDSLLVDCTSSLTFEIVCTVQFSCYRQSFTQRCGGVWKKANTRQLRREPVWAPFHCYEKAVSRNLTTARRFLVFVPDSHMDRDHRNRRQPVHLVEMPVKIDLRSSGVLI